MFGFDRVCVSAFLQEDRLIGPHYSRWLVTGTQRDGRGRRHYIEGQRAILEKRELLSVHGFYLFGLELPGNGRRILIRGLLESDSVLSRRHVKRQRAAVRDGSALFSINVNCRARLGAFKTQLCLKRSQREYFLGCLLVLDINFTYFAVLILWRDNLDLM